MGLAYGPNLRLLDFVLGGNTLNFNCKSGIIKTGMTGVAIPRGRRPVKRLSQS